MIKRSIGRTALLLVDIITINLALFTALYIHFEGQIPSNMMTMYYQSSIILTAAKLLIYRSLGLYDSIWEYASIEELIKVVLVCSLANVIGIVYLLTIGLRMYFGIFIVAFIFEVTLVGYTRFSFRVFRKLRNNGPLTKRNYLKNVLILGCGATGSLIAAEIKNHPGTYGRVIGFIDNDNSKYKKVIGGIKVLGNCNDIFSACSRYSIDEIIIAMPTVDVADMKNILTECKRTEAKVSIMPGVREMIDGHVSMSKIRDVEIEDLLGRKPIDLNIPEISQYIKGRTVMVTGGGGSIGSELCRQIAGLGPSKLIVLDIYENNAYDIQNELRRKYGNRLKLDVIIASVRDRKNIFNIISNELPDVIFHAAAHKHVPLMERSPKEAIKNNVFGTMNVAEAANQYNVERFVMISTDKAVNPTNIMGASKRMCELIIQGLAKQSRTNFVAVRFGNVLGSNGSVVPLFKKQIKEGGPVTVTHKDIERYFMTIPEAVQLVIQAGAIANGGEVFVLDMGEPVRIYDLAYDLIKLSGLKLNEDIEIKITGLRPGEKLYEELLMEDEGLETTGYEKIHIGQPSNLDYSILKKSFKKLEEVISYGTDGELIEIVQRMIPTYKNNKDVNRERKKKIESLEDYKKMGAPPA